MGRIARSVLSRLSPLFWAAAVAGTVVLVTHPGWGSSPARELVGLIILATGAAIGGTACGAIEATHDASVALLLNALLEERPTREPDRRHLRAAG